MVSENLLATYSLLSFIQDSQKEDKSKSILQLFIPIVQDTLNWMLSQNANTGEINVASIFQIRKNIKREKNKNGLYKKPFYLCSVQ